MLHFVIGYHLLFTVIKTARNIYKITYKTVTVYIRIFSMHLSGPHTDILYLHVTIMVTPLLWNHILTKTP